MNPETILYGTKIGEPDYMEQIITADAAKIAEATEWAKENGFDRLRIFEWDGSAPNFGKAVAV